MMRFKLHNAGPFDPDQFENYCKQIRELAESIKGNALDVEKQIRTARRSEWKRTTIRNVLSIIGAGVGAAVGAGVGAAVGAVPGAIAGAALPIVLQPMAEKVLKFRPVQIHGTEPVRALAELRDAMTADRNLLSMICPAFAKA